VKRGLHRRYGRAKGHLPLSRLSLAEYERRVDTYLRDFGGRPPVRGEHERLEVLNGWRNGWRPATLAQSIATVRETKKRRTK
jgi:hypothetical protein